MWRFHLLFLVTKVVVLRHFFVLTFTYEEEKITRIWTKRSTTWINWTKWRNNMNISILFYHIRRQLSYFYEAFAFEFNRNFPKTLVIFTYFWLWSLIWIRESAFSSLNVLPLQSCNTNNQHFSLITKWLRKLSKEISYISALEYFTYNIICCDANGEPFTGQLPRAGTSTNI